MHPYSSIETTAAWKKLRFILSVRWKSNLTDKVNNNNTNGSPNLGQKTRSYNNQQKKKKKKICKIVDFAVPADHRIKLKECEKRDKYLDLARELKKLWNLKVIIIPIVIGAFGMVTKGLLKSLEDLEVGDREENIQTTALLRTATILKRILGDLKRLDVIKTPVKNHKLTLIWKILKEKIMIIQTDHLIPARRPDLIIINKEKTKENLQNCQLCCPGWPQNKTERVLKER